MTSGPESDRVLLQHMRECLARIGEFVALGLVVEKDLPALTEAVNRMAARRGLAG